MGQNLLEPKMDLEHSRKVQSGIFLNQGVYFEYTQLLPGVEMFQLILGARRAPLLCTPPEIPNRSSTLMACHKNDACGAYTIATCSRNPRMDVTSNSDKSFYIFCCLSCKPASSSLCANFPVLPFTSYIANVTHGIFHISFNHPTVGWLLNLAVFWDSIK